MSEGRSCSLPFSSRLVSSRLVSSRLVSSHLFSSSRFFFLCLSSPLFTQVLIPAPPWGSTLDFVDMLLRRYRHSGRKARGGAVTEGGALGSDTAGKTVASATNAARGAGSGGAGSGSAGGAVRGAMSGAAGVRAVRGACAAVSEPRAMGGETPPPPVIVISPVASACIRWPNTAPEWLERHRHDRAFEAKTPLVLQGGKEEERAKRRGREENRGKEKANLSY